jgi:hypothetical protein
VGLAAVGIGLCGGAEAQQRARHACPPPGTHVLAKDRVLRVFSREVGGLTRSSVVGCLVKTGTRMTLLAIQGQCCRGRARIGTIALAGPFAAYLETRLGVDTSDTTLVVADVATRRILRERPVGSSIDAGIIFRSALTDLLVADDGAVAWIAERYEHRTGTSTVMVYAAAPTGEPTVLDESPAIGATSLMLSAHTLSWSDGAMRRSAQMP